MILGDTCTRRCGFCAVATGRPRAVDPEEPDHVAEAVRHLELKHAVLTMVDRDDLPDGGAGHVAAVIRAVRRLNPGCEVEVLTSDFRGVERPLDAILAEGPVTFSHNIETVPRLYPAARQGSRFEHSLGLLRQAVLWRDRAARPLVKTGLMVGLGEERDELLATFAALAGAGVEILTLGKREVNARAYCAWFNFRGADQQKKVGTLSGGERNRLMLAKLLQTGGNLLLLDEPTNDLDVDTLRALEDALLEFAGCAVVISHDRWFLDRIATHMLAFEGDSQVVFFEGNYQDYEKNRHERLGADADTPHRIKYKPLVRA